MGNAPSENPCNFTPQEMKRLYKSFKKMDKDQSGDLEIDEFLSLPELSQNPLVRRVVSIFDKNKDGTISFEEFVTGLSALYSDNENAKLEFAFKVYDIEDDGYISNGELFSVLKMMVGTNLTEIQLQQLVDRTIIKADEDFDGKISFEEFKKMVKDLDVAQKLTLSPI
ncbi:calcineurin Ca2+binding regulatory subunit CnaB (macronuclear) [Tetrahymena thermophila SB210]|uniref:Calcineurin Ca2+binding regulatory subunit CnaB n=1 Tax=Tetrahymena thermophila (strain SB210) TaxID=312017 RepID=I7LUB8_TETTS|nr:calcineurin Ca2+binding regulatory subunit CnaB [Tetrahymena thermophila SB210]EAR90983.1 calcineurin Ca2+binding regulatory subunit CnaB [Tetrahymena thermophila SB210]|eukprot:XP_001011228.1 calcineurin Ca2+binding regulatory subunit CnaB [Tetrahymena thermophila SB210]